MNKALIVFAQKCVNTAWAHASSYLKQGYTDCAGYLNHPVHLAHCDTLTPDTPAHGTLLVAFRLFWLLLFWQATSFFILWVSSYMLPLWHLMASVMSTLCPPNNIFFLFSCISLQHSTVPLPVPAKPCWRHRTFKKPGCIYNRTDVWLCARVEL